jgi:hypothetical protein
MRLRRISAPAILVAAMAFAGGAGAGELANSKTVDFLLNCNYDRDACNEFINQTLKTLDVRSVLGLSRTYKICAPLPLRPEEADQIVVWILSRAQQSTGRAAEDIVIASEDIWPCK